MSIKKDVERFIEKNIYFIENNDWDQVYSNLNSLGNGDLIGEFSYRMLESNINPLLYLSYVPDHFLFSTRVDPETQNNRELKSLLLPENIESIGTFAFYDSCISNLILSENITIIKDYPYNKMILHIPNMEKWKKIFLGIEANPFTCWEDNIIVMHNGNPLNKSIDLFDDMVKSKKYLKSGLTKNNIWNTIISLNLSKDELKLIRDNLNKILLGDKNK